MPGSACARAHARPCPPGAPLSIRYNPAAKSPLLKADRALQDLLSWQKRGECHLSELSAPSLTCQHTRGSGNFLLSQDLTSQAIPVKGPHQGSGRESYGLHRPAWEATRGKSARGPRSCRSGGKRKGSPYSWASGAAGLWDLLHGGLWASAQVLAVTS